MPACDSGLHPGDVRAGFTLIELLIVMVLLAIVGGGITMWMLNQQRFYRSENQIIDTRNRVRQAVNLLPTSFRSLSPGAGDIYAMSDSGVDFRSTTGSSVLCVVGSFTAGKAPAPGTQTIVIPPVNLLKNNALTAWLAKPSAGDSLFVYDPGAKSIAPGTWQAAQINQVLNVSGAGGCPSTTGLTQVTDTAVSYQLTITVPSDLKKGTVTVGSPIRFFRRIRYSLYQVPSGSWYLGYSDCLPGRSPVCSTTDALSGPYRPYSSSGSGATSGIRFSYLDSTGAVTSDPTQVALILIAARGLSKQSVLMPGEPPALYSDSMTTRVAVRNRN